MSSKAVMEQIKSLEDRLLVLQAVPSDDPAFREARQLWLDDYEKLNEMELHDVLAVRLQTCFDDYLAWSRTLEASKPKAKNSTGQTVVPT